MYKYIYTLIIYTHISSSFHVTLVSTDIIMSSSGIYVRSHLIQVGDPQKDRSGSAKKRSQNGRTGSQERQEALGQDERRILKEERTGATYSWKSVISICIPFFLGQLYLPLSCLGIDSVGYSSQVDKYIICVSNVRSVSCVICVSCVSSVSNIRQKRSLGTGVLSDSDN